MRVCIYDIIFSLIAGKSPAGKRQKTEKTEAKAVVAKPRGGRKPKYAKPEKREAAPDESMHDAYALPSPPPSKDKEKAKSKDKQRQELEVCSLHTLSHTRSHNVHSLCVG